MAKSNFTVQVDVNLLEDYAAEVIEVAKESNIFFTLVDYEVSKRGNKEVWRLAASTGSGTRKKKHCVTAYEGGAVTFQNIEVGSLDVFGTVVNKW